MIANQEETTAGAVVVAAGDDRTGSPYRLPGHELTVKVTAGDTQGRYFTAVLRAMPLSGPPLHMHTQEDEYFYVLEGEFVFQVGEQRMTAGPGTSVYAPRALPHTWQNCTDEPAVALLTIAPAGLEDLFAEIAARPLSHAELEQRMRERGLVLLGPPLARQA